MRFALFLGSSCRLRVSFLTGALLVGMVMLGSCAFNSNDDANKALDVVREYLSVAQSGDLDEARSYWTDINNPGGTWTMVARRDMEHVTQGHMTTFAGGWEIVKSEFQSITGLERPLAGLKLEVRVQPTGKIKKLDVGLVKHEGRWYIYSIYPGTW